MAKRCQRVVRALDHQRRVVAERVGRRGAIFHQPIARRAGALPEHVDNHHAAARRRAAPARPRWAARPRCRPQPRGLAPTSRRRRRSPGAGARARRPAPARRMAARCSVVVAPLGSPNRRPCPRSPTTSEASGTGPSHQAGHGATQQVAPGGSRRRVTWPHRRQLPLRVLRPPRRHSRARGLRRREVRGVPPSTPSASRARAARSPAPARATSAPSPRCWLSQPYIAARLTWL